MSTAAVVLVALLFLRLFYALDKDGVPGKHVSFDTAFWQTIVLISLLYWGGFFNHPS